jgi:hypothetical protein
LVQRNLRILREKESAKQKGKGIKQIKAIESKTFTEQLEVKDIITQDA